MFPSDDQMMELVRQRADHSHYCNQHPTYDLSCKGRIRLTCRCGWEYVFESEDNNINL